MTVLACPECDASEISYRNGRQPAVDPGTWHCSMCGADFDEPERRAPKTPGGTQSLPGGTTAAALEAMDPDDLVTDGGAYADADELLYATRTGGRSNGVVHADRDCMYLRKIDEADVLEKPPWAFDPDQDTCSECADGVELPGPSGGREPVTDGGTDPVAVYTVSNGQDKPRLTIHEKAIAPAGFEPGDEVLVYAEAGELRLAAADGRVLRDAAGDPVLVDELVTDGGEPSATRRAASEASDGGVDIEGAGSDRCAWCDDDLGLVDEVVTWDIAERGDESTIYRYRYCSEKCRSADEKAVREGGHMHPHGKPEQLVDEEESGRYG